MYRMCQWSLSIMHVTFDPMTSWRMHECSPMLAMSGLVSKDLHSRAWYCYGKMFSCIIFSLDSIVYSVDHSTVSVHIPVQRLQTPLEVLHYRLMMCNVLDMPRYECDNWNFEEVVPVISYTVCLFLPWESPYSWVRLSGISAMEWWNGILEKGPNIKCGMWTCGLTDSQSHRLIPESLEMLCS